MNRERYACVCVYSVVQCPYNCSGHGVCNLSAAGASVGKCVCDSDWSGEGCERLVCPSDCPQKSCAPCQPGMCYLLFLS